MSDLKELAEKLAEGGWSGEAFGELYSAVLAHDCGGERVALLSELDEARAALARAEGAVRARKGDMGIIPGSMGVRSYIVRGLGSEQSLMSCSHGAGRRMSRTEAKKTITLSQHIESTNGVECDKTAETLDETPAAYKDIDAVMAAQADLVEVVHTLKQVLCVKGVSEERPWRKPKPTSSPRTPPTER